jgi:hypothetical protein
VGLKERAGAADGEISGCLIIRGFCCACMRRPCRWAKGEGREDKIHVSDSDV